MAEIVYGEVLECLHYPNGDKSGQFPGPLLLLPATIPISS